MSEARIEEAIALLENKGWGSARHAEAIYEDYLHLVDKRGGISTRKAIMTGALYLDSLLRRAGIEFHAGSLAKALRTAIQPRSELHKRRHDQDDGTSDD